MSQDLFKGLNEEQKIGVRTTEGPVLILAGAGSGKTRVLTHRVAHLIGDLGVPPYRIMAITFTNKAAREMRERIDSLVGYGSDQVWVSTFHSACVRILRRFIDRIGYDPHFTIYDTDDQKSLMKSICKDMEIDTKRFKEKTFLNKISSAKDELINAETYMNQAQGDFIKVREAQVYREYQSRLRQNNALDFDDILMLTVELFKTSPDVLTYYQNRIQYLMVDEYQDTNTAQFEFVRLLAGSRKNLCVVGDDDQSIYKFRGANIYNILNFEKYFPDAKVIKLEQNYRSTQVILDAANAVIANNRGRKDKALWTENPKGEKISFREFDSGYEEAQFIALDIAGKVYRQECSYGDCAVLYRTNAQSRMIEEKLVSENIPYRIVGGVNFYQRQEIKDLIAYLKTVDNASDELAVRRIINIPRRGIGAASLQKVAVFAQANGYGFYEALEAADRIPTLGRTAGKIKEFTDFIEELRTNASEMSVPSLLKTVIEKTGYAENLRAENTDESRARLENIDELISKAVTYQDSAEEPTLSGFLEEVALIADIDNLEETTDYVVLMTLHSAKGLEFPYVYMAGMEDGLFPSYMSMTADDNNAEMEEERRLCYVGITRAKKKLTMTMARMRMVRGEMQYGSVSEFVREIPKELLDGEVYIPKKTDPFRFDPETDAVDGKSMGKAAMAIKAQQREALSYRKTTRKPVAAMSYGKRTMGTKIQKNPLDYGVGDRVRHQKFGEGTVTKIADGGRDYEVTVEFDRAGVKKMFASFAKLVKI
jgi:DNA helicase-2/ATP-dependent DNA helicase PcrA